MTGLHDLDLNELRGKNMGHRTPMTHQRDAFEKLNQVFEMPIHGKKGSLLVLPTGGGKTFTATNWICRNVLSRGIKVLWLAQSAYLLNQATESFVREAVNIQATREMLKIRTVSSSSSHANSGTIDPSDDVIVVTTQTAISDVLNESTDFDGSPLKFKLRQWVDDCESLFVVLDEAHHAPAYGCRTLLTTLKDIVPNFYLLGLTATPTHNDKRIRGWLDIIFEDGICYQIDENELIQDNVLALPAYISKPTGRDMEVDDQTYKRVVNEHKDLPEAIVDKLAGDSERNNFIVNDYLQNQSLYGKTIIFADRWFQCEYIAQKLNENGVRSDCIYVMTSANKAASMDGVGRRDNKRNEETLRQFRNGELDVLVNVKMLTEGVDVPDVKTVMLTRQTTSSIMLKQMVGRALRGKKAGAGADKDQANIIFFIDNWKRLLPFASIANMTGEAADVRSIRRGIPPMEWISIIMVQRACRDIQFAGKESYPSEYFLPIGWYDTEYTTSNNTEDEEMLTENQSVLVFESQESMYNRLIDDLLGQSIPDDWAKENVETDLLWDEVNSTFGKIINKEEIDVDGNLKTSIAHVVRHIAQNGTKPEFVPLDIRDEYDIDRLATNCKALNIGQINQRLQQEFSDERKFWKRLYKRYEWFYQAFMDAIMRMDAPEPELYEELDSNQEDTKEPKDYREPLLKRDGNKCCCCERKNGKGVRLEIDHIVPVKHGGTTTMDNLQILCQVCNLEKGVDKINFRNNRTMLKTPMPLKLIKGSPNETASNSITRIINFLYRTAAVCDILMSERRNGKNYYQWCVTLHEGNPIEWIETYQAELLEYIHDELGKTHVRSLIFK
ncbi:DEAD/DEAH box helicase family protein [Ruminococcaceae bacterium OttesenSCG-928-I18]|nr:DEAD/DEAH box helicase family protein [Ruminococcaceae bacterium OttesenSCG-928-I18]